MQGGVFTDSAELFYVSSGSGCCFGFGSGQQYLLDGLHVFETNTWQRIKRSTNYHHGDYSYFNYYYLLGCDGTGSWSPEGLTIWDLDDGRAPNISGQLHVMAFLYTVVSGDNEGFMEHYTNKIYVDSANGVTSPFWPDWETPLPGDIDNPFKTVGFAFDWYPAWDGAEIVVKSGSYNETGTYSTRVKVTSKDGTAIIGAHGTPFYGVQLFKDANYQGESGFYTSNTPDLHDLGDETSSVRIFNISEVILYHDNDYQGDSLIVTHDISSMPSGWNDVVSSLRIVRNKK